VLSSRSLHSLPPTVCIIVYSVVCQVTVLPFSNSLSIIYSILYSLPPVVLSVVCTVSSTVCSLLYYFPLIVSSLLYFLPPITASSLVSSLLYYFCYDMAKWLSHYLYSFSFSFYLIRKSMDAWERMTQKRCVGLYK